MEFPHQRSDEHGGVASPSSLEIRKRYRFLLAGQHCEWAVTGTCVFKARPPTSAPPTGSSALWPAARCRDTRSSYFDRGFATAQPASMGRRDASRERQTPSPLLSSLRPMFNQDIGESVRGFRAGVLGQDAGGNGGQRASWMLLRTRVPHLTDEVQSAQEGGLISPRQECKLLD
ncbi:unnamed protein product [Lota lota]